MAVKQVMNDEYSLNLLPGTSWTKSEWQSGLGDAVDGVSVFSHGGINPCLNDQTCFESSTGTVVIDDYVCRCADGWSGQVCEIDVDECASDACLNGAECIESGIDASIEVNYYVCMCQVGYSGFNTTTSQQL